jgi:hypothetical protein
MWWRLLILTYLVSKTLFAGGRSVAFGILLKCVAKVTDGSSMLPAR